MSDEFNTHIGDPAAEPSEVVFLHARPYPEGYVIDVRPSEGLVSQFTVKWAALDPTRDWTAHDLVEFFINRTMPRLVELAGDHDFVLYLDCLRIECGRPHVYTRATLQKHGFLPEVTP